MAESNHILKQLFDMNFPIKLWTLINSNHQAIKWDDNSEHILAASSSSLKRPLSSIIVIDRELLDNYLKSKISIFAAKGYSTFFIEMGKHNFKHLPPQTQMNPINWHNDKNQSTRIFKFYHENFLNGQPELLSKIVKPKETSYINNSQSNLTTLNPKFCLKLAVRPLARAENLKRKLLKFQNQDDVNVLKIPGDCFLNTTDTTTNYEENPEYAGFYGHHVSTEKIKQFYDDFLPHYVETNGK